MLSSRSDEFGLVHERRDGTGETRASSGSEVRGFQSFEPRTLNFGSRLSLIISRFTRHGPRPLAEFFSILLMFQFVSHSAQQMRHAKGLLEGLPCPEEFRDIQDILFPSCA